MTPSQLYGPSLIAKLFLAIFAQCDYVFVCFNISVLSYYAPKMLENFKNARTLCLW